MESTRKMSRAYMRSINNPNGINLNECLHPQMSYIELDIKDPDGRIVCKVAMAHDQFVRLLMCNSEVPVTLVKYRDGDGNYLNENVPKPESVRDRVIDRLGEVGDSLQSRVTDLRKDIYELTNSPKVGKKAMEQLLADVSTIESHLKSNYSFYVECAAEEVCGIQENAKSQLALFANQHFGVDMNAKDFAPLIEGTSQLALPDKSELIVDNYKMKERIKKPIADMTAMEVADEISVLLRRIEQAEDKYLNSLAIDNKDRERKLLFFAQASHTKNNINITFINYQGSTTVDLEKAKKYLEFLISVKNYGEFKKIYKFE